MKSDYFWTKRLKQSTKYLQLAVLTVPLILLGCGPSTPPEKVSELFFSYMTNFEHQRAYDLLSKEQKENLLAQNINREAFFGYLKAPIGNPLWMGLAYEMKKKVSKGDNEAQISFSLKDMQFQGVVTGECDLILENKLWQVDHLKFDGGPPEL